MLIVSSKDVLNLIVFAGGEDNLQTIEIRAVDFLLVLFQLYDMKAYRF